MTRTLRLPFRALFLLAVACSAEEPAARQTWIRDGVGDGMVAVSSNGFATDEQGLKLVDLQFTVGKAVKAQSFTLQLVRDGEVVTGHEELLGVGTSKFGPYALPGPVPERMQDVRAMLSIEIEGRDPLRIERTMSDADRAAK